MKRKNKEVKKRHWIIINIAKLILTPWIKIKYKYQYPKYRNLKNKGPFLVLGNHAISMDPILLSHSFPFHIYYFATEQIFNLGLISKLLVFAANPIKKSKSKSDMSAIRKARTIINEGGSVGIYPDGNIPYDGKLTHINEATVKLIRLLKVPVIFFATKGLALSDPRWSIFVKKGKTSGEVTKILYPEEYSLLSDEELYNYIVEKLSTDEYDTDIVYKGKNMAVGLERFVFLDLITGKPFTTFSKKDMLYSSDSNFTLKYFGSGHVLDQDNTKYKLTELNDLIITKYWQYYQNTKSFALKRNAQVFDTTNTKKRYYHVNNIILGKDKIIVSGKFNKEFHFDDVESLAIQGKRRIIIYYGNETWLLTFKDLTSPYIYLLTYQFYKKGEMKDEDFSVREFGL